MFGANIIFVKLQCKESNSCFKKRKTCDTIWHETSALCYVEPQELYHPKQTQCNFTIETLDNEHLPSLVKRTSNPAQSAACPVYTNVKNSAIASFVTFGTATLHIKSPEARFVTALASLKLPENILRKTGLTAASTARCAGNSTSPRTSITSVQWPFTLAAFSPCRRISVRGAISEYTCRI